MDAGSGWAARRLRSASEAAVGFLLVAIPAVISLNGCMMVGPDYTRPPEPQETAWIETDDPTITREDSDYRTWWKAFNDPVLDNLVETAYQQNPSLQAAGVRVLEAQARRGIAIGTLFPQQQGAFGGYLRTELSENRANQAGLQANFNDWQVGLDAAWELDIWGRFRRGIEAADAELLASVASYDDVLVSLVAEVATNYIFLRTLQERLEVALANVAIQRGSYEIADAKFRGGAVTELDAAQAASLLHDTEAQIPGLEANIRQTENTLCILLGFRRATWRTCWGRRNPFRVRRPRWRWAFRRSSCGAARTYAVPSAWSRRKAPRSALPSRICCRASPW
jgi:outer membrane protein TolC